MFCPKCGSPTPDGNSFCGKCGSPLPSGRENNAAPTASDSVQNAATSTPAHGAAPSAGFPAHGSAVAGGGTAAKTALNPKLMVGLVAAVVVVAAAVLVWRFAASPGMQEPENVYQINRMLAMQPEDIGVFMDEQGYAFADASRLMEQMGVGDDIFSPSWMDAGYSASEVTNLLTAGNMWVPATMADALDNPDAYDDMSSEEAASLVTDENGYLVTVYFLDAALTAEEQGQEAADFGPAYLVRHRMGADALAAGTQPASITVTANFNPTYASDYVAPEYTEILRQLQGNCGLPDPELTAAYRTVDGYDSAGNPFVASFGYGFGKTNGVEYFYSIYGNPTGGSVSVTPLDMALAAYGASDKDGLIAAVKQQLDRNYGQQEQWEQIAGPDMSDAQGAAEDAGDGAAESAEDASAPAGGGAQAAGASAPLDDYSWAELSRISQEIAATDCQEAAIEVAQKYHLCNERGQLDGSQRKSVTLSDGTTVQVMIAGFAHDDRSDGSGKAGITFIFTDTMGLRAMNGSKTNSGGWASSELRSWLDGSGMAMLPSDLQDAIVPVDKLTNNVGETDYASSVSATSDRLWLYSPREVFGQISDQNTDEVYNAEGEQYQLFYDIGVGMDQDNQLMRECYGDYYGVWSRSPQAYYDDCFEFFTFAPDFTLRPSHADQPEDEVVPGFCI